MKELSVLLIGLSVAQALDGAEPLKQSDISFRHEVQRAIDKGLDYLKSSQSQEGWWSTADHPSVTALALSAFMGDPAERHTGSLEVKKGYAHVLRCAQPDGGVYVTGLQNYNTAISMMALLAAKDPKYDPILRKARAYLVNSQIDAGEAGKLDTPVDGGVGYGSKYAHSDMNNTLTALEALYYSKHLVQDGASDEKDLNWQAAIEFIRNCQNMPGVNTQSWVSADPRDRGGFIYYPGHSMAGGVTNASGKVSLRSYGSISYAGLLSYVYADVKRSDSHVVAVMEWLRSNYALDENPGMGPQGYYYYIHLMTKALNAAQIDTLQLRDDRKIDWRREVAMRLINLQKNDGSWQNDNGRWWERDQNLVTAYAVMSLEIIYRGM